jgi:hypothetical protein
MCGRKNKLLPHWAFSEALSVMDVVKQRVFFLGSSFSYSSTKVILTKDHTPDVSFLSRP